ncbi:MAG: 1,4-alpha-glucan-branching enzyme, partial [Bacteroidaceae bacterium]|nr:1,4-alpha-glucan-branching enzyme [Bacteroidaceae bacterium]
MLNLIKNDPWLKPYEAAIEGRYDYYCQRLQTLTEKGQRTLTEFANGHLWYGLHRTDDGWVFREWAPNATAIWLVGDFNDWQRRDEYRLTRLNPHGDWEVTLSDEALRHGQHYKMLVEWNG